MLCTAPSQASSAYRSRSMSPAILGYSKTLSSTQHDPEVEEKLRPFQAPSKSSLMRLENFNGALCPILIQPKPSLKQPNSISESYLKTLRGGSGANIFIIRRKLATNNPPDIQSNQNFNIARKCMLTNHSGLKAFIRDVDAGASEKKSIYLKNVHLKQLLDNRRSQLLDFYYVSDHRSNNASLVAEYFGITDINEANKLLDISKPLSDYIMKGLRSIDVCVDKTINLISQIIEEQKITQTDEQEPKFLQNIPSGLRREAFDKSYGIRAISRWKTKEESNSLCIVDQLKKTNKIEVNEVIYRNPIFYISSIVDALGSFSKGIITHGDCQQSNILLQRIGNPDSLILKRIDHRPLELNDSFMDIVKLLAGPIIIQSVDRLHGYQLGDDPSKLEISQHPKKEEYASQLNRLEEYRIQLEEYLLIGNVEGRTNSTDFNKFCQKVFQSVANNSVIQENYSHLWLRLTTWVELACAGGFCFQGLQKSETEEEQLDFTNRTLTFVCAMAKELPKIKMHLNTFLETHKNDISLDDDIKNQLLTLQNALENINVEISPEQD